MKRPRIIVVEDDGRLASQLAGLAADRRWSLRECRRAERCLSHLARDGAAVVVVRLAEVPASEIVLLSRIAGQLPGVRTVAVGGRTNVEVVAGVVWDLGVDFALFPPTPIDLLPEIVAGLMEIKPRGNKRSVEQS